jgi:hypothetical protein
MVSPVGRLPVVGRATMNKSTWLQLGFAAWMLHGLFAFACSEDVARTKSSGESHFLDDCKTDCAAGLDCIEGRCTRECTNDQACEALAQGASCREREDAPDDVAVCDVACGANRDCAPLGAGFACDAGACRQGVPASGTGGSPSGGNTSGDRTGGAPSTDGGGVAGAGGVPPETGAAGTSGAPPTAGRGANSGGRPATCQSAVDEEECVSLGCVPVSGTVYRLVSDGGSGGATQCDVVGMQGRYLACAWGSGGDVGGTCYCREGDPTECAEAPTAIEYAGTEWIDGFARSACDCAPF